MFDVERYGPASDLVFRMLFGSVFPFGGWR